MLPDLFFVYDSRAVTALREFTGRVPTYLQHILQQKNIDREYAKFFCKCFDLKNKIELYHKTTLIPRVVDNILIETANNKKNNLTRKGSCLNELLPNPLTIPVILNTYSCSFCWLGYFLGL